jgi:hypothetical protein
VAGARGRGARLASWLLAAALLLAALLAGPRLDPGSTAPPSATGTAVPSPSPPPSASPSPRPRPVLPVLLTPGATAPSRSPRWRDEEPPAAASAVARLAAQASAEAVTWLGCWARPDNSQACSYLVEVAGTPTPVAALLAADGQAAELYVFPGGR